MLSDDNDMFNDDVFDDDDDNEDDDDDDDILLLSLFKRHPVKLSKPKIFLDVSQLVKLSPTSKFKFFPIMNDKDDHD